MFGWRKKSKDKKSTNKPDTGASQPSREELKAQAIANARKARATLGEENVQKLAQMLQDQQSQMQEPEQSPQTIPDVSQIQDPGQYKPPEGSPAEAAKRILEEMDQGDVANKLREMIENERN